LAKNKNGTHELRGFKGNYVSRRGVIALPNKKDVGCLGQGTETHRRRSAGGGMGQAKTRKKRPNIQRDRQGSDGQESRKREAGRERGRGKSRGSSTLAVRGGG